MTGWRFYPLADTPRGGVLWKPGERPVAAHFFTPEEAKREAPRRLEDKTE